MQQTESFVRQGRRSQRVSLAVVAIVSAAGVSCLLVFPRWVFAQAGEEPRLSLSLHVSHVGGASSPPRYHSSAPRARDPLSSLGLLRDPLESPESADPDRLSAPSIHPLRLTPPSAARRSLPRFQRPPVRPVRWRLFTPKPSSAPQRQRPLSSRHRAGKIP